MRWRRDCFARCGRRARRTPPRCSICRRLRCRSASSSIADSKDGSGQRFIEGSRGFFERSACTLNPAESEERDGGLGIRLDGQRGARVRLVDAIVGKEQAGGGRQRVRVIRRSRKHGGESGVGVTVLTHGVLDQRGLRSGSSELTGICGQLSQRSKRASYCARTHSRTPTRNAIVSFR